MALFRRHGDQDRWDQSQRRFRQPEYEGTYSEDARRARPGERGLGWARRRDIDDRMSQQAAPRGGGHYDRSGEERYAEGLDEFEQHEGYRGRPSAGWELDEGGVQFGRGGERYGGEGSYRQGEYGRGGGYGSSEYGRTGGYARGFGQDEYGRGGFGERGGYSRGESSEYGRGFYGGGESGWRGEARDYGRGGWAGSRGERTGQFRGVGPRGYQRSDERIRDDVCDLLTDDEEIDASDLSIDVSSGVVVLTGTVDNRETKRRAEDVAESVSGVREVQNNLRIQSQSSAQRGHEQHRGMLGGQQQTGAQNIGLGTSGQTSSTGQSGPSGTQSTSAFGQSTTGSTGQPATGGEKSKR